MIARDTGTPGGPVTQEPPNPQYPPQYSPQSPPPGYPQPTNTMAVLALVFAFVFSPLGIVFGVIGRRQIRRTGEGGSGLATAGLVLGIVFTLFYLVAVLAMIAVFLVAATELQHLPNTPTPTP